MKLNKTDIFFYSKNISDSYINLNSDESIHCLKVLRFNINNLIRVTDGKGKIANCKIVNNHINSCKLKIISKEFIPNNIADKIHIVISPTKNITRFEWFLEKTVELGIREITPIQTKRSERNTMNYDRLQKKMITALKQSKNVFLPILNPIEKFDDFIKKHINENKFICHNKNNNIPYLKDMIIKGENYTILIGPEGGFTKSEIKNAEKYSYKQILLGNSRYRTETAGILACHTIHVYT